MQTQNYVYYMHFLVLKESEQRCARALFLKKLSFMTLIGALLAGNYGFDLS